MQKDKKKYDSYVIRTHAGEPTRLAGERLNHSAKLSRVMMFWSRIGFMWSISSHLLWEEKEWLMLWLIHIPERTPQPLSSLG